MATIRDVFVYPRPIDPNRGSVALEVGGPPVLIIEVLSESTYDVDLDLPTHAFLAPGIRAWRLVEGVYRPWEPDANGRWQSKEIAVAIGLEGTLATMYTRAGERQLREGEVAEELARLRGEVERMRRLLDARQGAPE